MENFAFIAGFQKCGTSALFEMMAQHSEIATARPTMNVESGFRGYPKELHYFNYDLHYEKGLDWYKSLFPTTTKIKIEATPEYAGSECCLRRIFKDFSDAKLIVLLRDPVDRALSAWNHWLQTRGWPIFEPDGSFESNICKELNTLEKFRETNGFVGRGIYVEKLRMIFKYFDRNQVLIVFTENLKENHSDEMSRIQRFLGVPERRIETRNVHSRVYSEGGIDCETLIRLREIYRPYNHQLEVMLGEVLPWCG